MHVTYLALLQFITLETVLPFKTRAVYLYVNERKSERTSA